MDGIEQNNKLTREQKVGVTLLFVLTLLTVGLGFLQMRNNLISPFVYRAANNGEAKELQDFQVELQKIDTDQDGINDYEELNFYTTSPYIPDTDSDGKTDKDEIDAGTDPLCPEGKVCENAQAIPDNSSSTVNTSVPLTGGSSVPLFPQNNVDNQQEINELMSNPAKIRELLKQTGQIPPEQIDALDDATLVKLLKDIMKQAPTQPNPQENSSLNNSSASTTVSSTVDVEN